MSQNHQGQGETDVVLPPKIKALASLLLWRALQVGGRVTIVVREHVPKIVVSNGDILPLLDVTPARALELWDMPIMRVYTDKIAGVVASGHGEVVFFIGVEAQVSYYAGR